MKINVLDLYDILFVGLKLTHQIDWSWWWVLAPIWVEMIIQGIAGSSRRKRS